jgi:uncharacterized protein YaaN involved in tellurite resistance
VEDLTSPAVLNPIGSQVQILPMGANLPAVADPRVHLVPLKPLTADEVSNMGSAQYQHSAAVQSKITSIAKTSDMDDVGKLLTQTVQAAKGYDLDTLSKSSGLFGIFKRGMAKASEIRMRFDSVDETVNRLIKQLDAHAVKFRGRIADLQALSRENENNFRALTPMIADLKDRADWMEANQPGVDPNDPFSAREHQRWIKVIDDARLRADALSRLQLLYQQYDVQIEQYGQNSADLTALFQNMKTEMVPAMEMSFTMGVLGMEQKKAVEFADNVHKTTQEAIKKAGDLFGQNTIAVATAATRSNIDLDTFRHTHEKITTALAEADRIHAEMRTRLTNETPQIEQLSRDLATALASR